jgi:hypothetical protein
MTRKFHWTLILPATATISIIILNTGALAMTGFHLITAFVVVLLLTFVFIYWLIRGLYKKEWGFVLKIILTPLIICIIHYFVNYDRIQIDGGKVEIFTFFFGEDSNYPPDFSHRAFNKIKIGMTKVEVIELVGVPVDIFPWDDRNNHNKVGF